MRLAIYRLVHTFVQHTRIMCTLWVLRWWWWRRLHRPVTPAEAHARLIRVASICAKQQTLRFALCKCANVRSREHNPIVIAAAFRRHQLQSHARWWRRGHWVHCHDRRSRSRHRIGQRCGGGVEDKRGLSQQQQQHFTECSGNKSY